VFEAIVAIVKLANAIHVVKGARVVGQAHQREHVTLARGQYAIWKTHRLYSKYQFEMKNLMRFRSRFANEVVGEMCARRPRAVGSQFYNALFFSKEKSKKND
jgi:hypothetical protein